MVAAHEPAQAPLAAGQRIALIDALRGFALLGVLVVNVPVFAAVDGNVPVFSASWFGVQLVNLGFDDKFWTLLSLIFGVGFARTIERVGPARYAWRLVLLFLFGLLHLVFLSFIDVLALYALMGALLLLARTWSVRTLVIVGVACAVLGTIGSNVITVMWPSRIGQHFGQIYDAMSRSSYLDLVRVNYTLRLDMVTTNLATFLPELASRFFLGYALGRAALLDDPERAAPFFRRLLWWAAPPFVLLAGLLFAGAALHLGEGPAKAPQIVSSLLFELETVAAAATYLSGFVLLWRRPAWRRVLESSFAPLGRAALTFYLLQSAVCVPLFYHFGFGLGGQLQELAACAFALGFFALECVLARLLLARWSMGPVEWLWRSLAYLHVLPVKRQDRSG